MSPAVVLATPTANSMAALNASVQYSVQAGGSYYFTLTNPPGATTVWSATNTFQYSTNGGGSWISFSVNPVAAPASSASGSTATANGLWLAEIPAGVGSQVVLVRATLTAYTSGTVYFFVAPANPNQKVLLPWVYTVTSANNMVGPIECSNFSEIDFQISAITTTVYTAQGTNDPTLATWFSLPVQDLGLNTSVGAQTITAASTYRIQPSGFKWIRIQCTTTGTVATVQGVCGVIGSPVNFTGFGSAIAVASLPTLAAVTTVTTVTTVSTVTSLSQIAASVPLMNISNGSTNKGLGVTLGSATTNADYAAQSWAAVSGNGATIAPAIGDGQSCSFAVNTTAFTAGSSTGQFVYLQESPDNGTTWMDIWGCEAVTGTGFVRIPPVPIGGRRRMRWVQRAGAATTSTVSVTAMGLPGLFPIQRQFFDWGTTGTAANSILITGGAQTTSTSTITSALGTITQTTAAYPIEGCSFLTIKALVSGGTCTTAPVVTVQVSDDFTNWETTTSTLTLPTVAGMTSLNISGLLAKYVRLNLTTAQAGGTPIALTYFSILARQ
ncbi:unnamed protein product [Sphagnum jensenii]|uniref:Uncharacterized protein n=1 Tax=Sphagnum jensenii TaxID=128206 RepID=A0ABP0V8A7_9BRYO